MADFENDLWLATYKMGRTNLDRLGPGQPNAHLAVLAAAHQLRKLDLDAPPSVAENSGPGQPSNNNAGDLGTGAPQVSEETHAQDLRDLEEMLAAAEEEFVSGGGREVEMGESGGDGGGGEMVVFGEKEVKEQGVKRDWGGPGKKFSNPAPGYSRRTWEGMERGERRVAWEAVWRERRNRKQAARWR